MFPEVQILKFFILFANIRGNLLARRILYDNGHAYGTAILTLCYFL